MSTFAWILVGSSAVLAGLAIRVLRRAKRTMDAILAESRKEDPE